MSHVFEQAGKQVQFYENGMFYASLPEDERETLLTRNPSYAQNGTRTGRPNSCASLAVIWTMKKPAGLMHA